jgi:hypothetical protein
VAYFDAPRSRRRLLRETIASSQFFLERTVTSSEIHEQITAFVEERLDEAEYRNKVRGQIAPCPDCRSTYEHELATRMVVHERAPQPSLLGAPGGTIGNPAAEPGGGDYASLNGTRAHGEGERRSSFLTSPIGIVIALVVVVASGYMLLRSTDRGGDRIIVETPAAGGAARAPKGPENFFNKADDNFSALAGGKLSVQHATADQAELAKYFKENGVAYDVTFAPVHAALDGGIISEHGTTRLAHLVYMKDDATIYLFEVPVAMLRKGSVVTIPDVVFQQLDAGKTIWEEPSGHRLAVFKKGDLVCAVVSNARREDLEKIISTK